MDLLTQQEALIVFPEYFPSFFQQGITGFPFGAGCFWAATASLVLGVVL